MNLHRAAVVAVAIAIICPVDAGASAAASASLELDGVAGYVEGQARETIIRGMNAEAAGWAAEAFAETLGRRQADAGATVVLPVAALVDAATRAEVQAALKERLAAWLPAEAQRIVAGEILGGAGDEAAAIAQRTAAALAEELGDVADAIVGAWYDAAVEKIRGEIMGKTAGLLDITRLRASIDGAFRLSTAARLAEAGLAKLVGDATVAAIRRRIEDALDGRLPPEAIAALERGPEEFEKFVAEVESRLPGTQLRQLTNSILNRPLIKLPSAVYAAMLAASAAGHYARAFAGPTVDAWELKRGGEVTRVMVWQLENREWISLTLAQLGQLARGVALRVGAGEAFDQAMVRVRAPLDRVQTLADRIDTFVTKPLDRAGDDLRDLVGTIQDELESIQGELVSPIERGIDALDRNLAEAGDAIEGLLPGGFDGVPKNWQEARENLGLGTKKPAGVLSGPAAAITEEEEVPVDDPSLSDELDPVLLHNGEFIHRVTDVVIPGRGIDFRFTRTHRARSDFLGELGWRWTHSYAERLLPWDDGVSEGLTHVDAEGLKFFYRREGDRFVAPEGATSELAALDDGGHAITGANGIVAFFDAEGKLARRCDRFGNCEELRYDRRGLVSSVVDPFGREVRIERRPDGLIRRVRDFAGRIFAYDYNDAQELIGATAPATPDFPKGKTTAYRSEPGHRVAMIVDPAGRAYLRNRYDDEGRVVAQRYGGGPWMRVVYGAGEGPVVSRAWVTDAKGVTRLYEHDAAGHLVRRWRFEGDAYRLLPLPRPAEREALAAAGRTLDAFGQVIEERSSDDALVRYEYYSSEDPDGDGAAILNAAKGTGGGYLKRIVWADGRATSFAYDPVGNIVVETDGEGKTTRYRVNALNQIVREERPGEPARRYVYDANDDLRRVETERDGRWIVREFVSDELGRLVLDRRQVAPGRFLEARFAYDATGLLVAATLPEGNRIAWTYDEEGLLICVVRGAGSPEEARACVERDERGEIVALVDGEGERTTLARDEAGDVVALTDPLGNRSDIARDARGSIVGRQAFDSRGVLLAAARFSYDGDGRLASRGDLLWRDDPTKSRWVERPRVSGASATTAVDEGRPPLRDGVRLERDDLGRPIAAIRGRGADAATTRYAWTGNGRLASITDPAGKTTRFVYDALDRLVLELFPDGTRQQTSYDRRDRVVASIDRNGSVLRMTYDAAGRLVARVATPVAGVIGTRKQLFAWDGLGRLVSAVDANDASDPGDDVVSRFVYDSLSRPVAEEASRGWITRLFDDAGRMTALMPPDGAATYFTYGEDGRLAGVFGPEGELSPPVIDARGGVAFDESGRVARESGFAGVERTYARDGLGRLTAAEDAVVAVAPAGGKGPPQPVRSWRYAWDAGGRLTMPGEREGARAFDAAGGLVADGGRDYRYDAFGRLTGIWENKVLLAAYRYDAFDRRVAKIVGGAERHAVWNGWQLAGESLAERTVSYVSTPGAIVPAAAVSNGTVRRLVPDRLGSVIAVTDAAGRVRARCGYDPYGGEIPASPLPQPGAGGDEGGVACDAMDVPFGFAGGIRDDETGLLYLRHRYYDPARGRFLTPDPLGFKVSMQAEDADFVAPSLAYHAGQGGASRATFPNRPLAAVPDYGAFPFGRSLVSSGRTFLPGETDLVSYAQGDPSTFADPLGLASLLFDRSEEKIMLLMDGGYVWGSFDAANNTVNPGADPYRVGGNGPFPNGTYAVGVPEFYSAEYRYDVTINYELGNLWPGETIFEGREWRRDRGNSRDYNVAYGGIRIRVGSWATPEGRAAVLRGLMIHGGRHDYRKKTLGCIRVDDADLELLAVGIINLARDGDPVTSLVVRE